MTTTVSNVGESIILRLPEFGEHLDKGLEMIIGIYMSCIPF
jgi:hypothetical protein